MSMQSLPHRNKNKNLTNVRVFVLFSTLAIVSFFGYFVALIARGYQFDTVNLSFIANGILVAKSDPDGASIYIDGNLKGATNTNLKLAPKTYDVEIKKDGYISWKKKLTIKKEEVTQITAHLFKTAPSFSPITFDGAESPVVSSDFSKIAYTNDEGLWIMSVSTLPLGFANDPFKVTDGVLKGATYSFSPNNRELLLETKSGIFVLNTNEFVKQSDLVASSTAKDVILKNWKLENDKKIASELKLVPSEVSEILSKKSSSFSFSADETMVMYTASNAASLKPDLITELPGSSTQAQERDIKVGKTYIYDIKEDRNFMVNENGKSLYWLPTSRHLVLPDKGKIIVMDYDGTNRQVVFSGDYIDPHAYPFVNASKLLILTNLGSPSTTSNLYSLSIK